MSAITVSYRYVLMELIKNVLCILLWVLYLSFDITCFKVRFVNFKFNLSVLPKPYETNFFQVFVTIWTCFLAFYNR